jgi:hypothetical protein
MRGILAESPDDLPIRAPQDNWETERLGDEDYITRTFSLSPAEIKMLVCDIIDAQEEMGHSVEISIEGDKLTVRSTTHEHGEPTERDREIARYIDTSYDEMRRSYK